MIIRDEIKRAGGMEELCRKLIDQANVSRQSRRDLARGFRMMFHTGSLDGQTRRVNLIRNYVDKLASLLFSPSDLRYEISFDADEAKEWAGVADLAGRHLNREMKVRKATIAFSQALEAAMIDCSCFIKLVWSRNGLTPRVVRQHFMGVGREDTTDFADQDFFTHTYYLTEDQLRRLLVVNPKKDAILKRVEGAFTEGPIAEDQMADILPGSYLHDIIVGGQTTGVSSSLLPGSTGTVGIFGPPRPMISAQVASRLIEMTDIWVYNDLASQGEGGWATIRFCEPGVVVEGEEMVRNLGDLPHDHPFIKISPNDMPDYFWGVSELAPVAYNQEWYANRVGNVDDIFALRARPPRSFEGFSGITQEKMRALLTRGGTFASDSPAGTTKITSHAPDMPGEALELLKLIHESFDEAGGMTPSLQGQGESGVRSAAQASQLVRMSTPRLRDKATLVESQVSDMGHLAFRMMQVKEARVFQVDSPEGAPPGRQFVLSQLPEDAIVSVDSHTSSPAFSGDNMQMAFALIRVGAIDAEDLLNMVQPPHVDELILKYRQRQAQQQAMMAKLEKQDPEGFMKMMTQKKR